MESEDKEKDLKAATALAIEGKVPCVSPPVDKEDIDDEEDNDDDDNDKEDDNDDDGDKEDDDDNDDDNEEYTDDNKEEGIFDFNSIDVNGMSEYEVLRLRRIRRNKARLASLGLLEGMTSAASPSANRTNRKKRVATQGDFVRRIQPKRNVFRPTSYKDLDDPVISKRTCSIDSSDTGKEDTGSKRMDKAEYSPSGGDDEEVDDEDELESYDEDDDNKLNRRFPQAKAEAAVDLVIVDKVEQDHSDLEDQFIEEVCSGSNDVTVLTPPNFNEDTYANKLALYPCHQCVVQSPESIKAIEDRDVFFHDVVNSRNITHLQGLPIIRHQAPRENQIISHCAMDLLKIICMDTSTSREKIPMTIAILILKLVKGRTRLSKSHLTL